MKGLAFKNQEVTLTECRKQASLPADCDRVR